MAVPIQVIRLGVIGMVIGSFIAFKYVAANMVDDKINGAMLNAGIPASSFSYDNACVDLLGLNVHLEGVKISMPGQQTINVEEIIINDFDAEHTVPEFVDVEIEGIEAKRGLNSLPFRDVFEGMDEVSVNFAIKYEFDADEKILNIKEISESVDNLGEISFSTELHNVSSIQNLVQRVMMNPSSISIGKSELEYEDNSLVEKVMAMNAKKQGLSTDEFKAKMLKELNKELQEADAREDTDLEQEFLSAMIDFIEDAGAFKISINPENPMTFREISRNNTNENLKKLQLEIN